MSESIDRSFRVSFLHRVRFTDDVLGGEQSVLADVLETSAEGPARLLFFVDSELNAARGGLRQTLEALVEAHGRQLMLAGDVDLVEGGEAAKNDARIVQRLLDRMRAAELDRRSYVVVLGGGAVLDAVGFAAAIAHRGIRLVRLPTTTLAQADSGVGVKNGVNFFGKKNWVGAFAVPWAVINDTELLRTLPDREYRAGFAEVVKVSLLKDAALFERLAASAERVRERDWSAAVPMIRASAELHLDHITRGGDPFETQEARPLDFGHWSAHRLEALTEFEVRHGEAVGIGLALDTIYSSLTLGLPSKDVECILGCLRALGLPLFHPALAEGRIAQGLEEFRQHLGGRLTITLLRGVGDPVEVHELDLEILRRATVELERFAGAPDVSTS